MPTDYLLATRNSEYTSWGVTNRPAWLTSEFSGVIWGLHTSKDAELSVVDEDFIDPDWDLHRALEPVDGDVEGEPAGD